MDSTKQNKEIAGFWEWFSKHHSELAAPSLPQQLIEDLENHLFAIHRLDWEIGPGLGTRNFFALSPRGDEKLLPLTRSIIAQAIKINNWDFYPAKPPRQWDLFFKLDVGGQEVEVDGKLWEFVAYRFEDGTYDLIFRPNRGHKLPEDYLYWAASIILDGEMGEEKRIELIKNIEIVKSWDETAAKSAQPVRVGLLANLLTK